MILIATLWQDAKGMGNMEEKDANPWKGVIPYKVDMKTLTSLMKVYNKLTVENTKIGTSALNMPHEQRNALQGNVTEKKLEDLPIHPTISKIWKALFTKDEKNL
jgi:hypothetical protein